MRTYWFLLALVVAAGLSGCGKRAYRKRTTVNMPRNEYMTLTRLKRYYQRQNVDGVLDTIDKRCFPKYFEVRSRLMTTFRTQSQIKLSMEVHYGRERPGATVYEVHWKRTSYDIWKRKFLPRRGLTYFVVSHAQPWRIIDVHGDEFF